MPSMEPRTFLISECRDLKMDTVSLTFSLCTAKASATSWVVATLISELLSSSFTTLLICSVDSFDWSARTLISSATTANPLPCSPARAASILAFKARRFVWLEIPAIISAALRICWAELFVSSVCWRTFSMDSPFFSLMFISSCIISSTESLYSLSVCTLCVRLAIFVEI